MKAGNRLRKYLFALCFFILFSLPVRSFSNDNSSISTSSQIKKFPALYYEYQIEEIGKSTPIKLDYNADVQKYIDLYLDSRSDKLSEYLSLKDYYFPIFEEALDRYNLPLELKYLPIVESGLDPRAQSSSGAMGLWQLLYNSAKLLGLEINSYIDERCDAYLSTDAACRYLKYLYSLYNDWQLALAAYNGGPGEIRNAIARSGGKTNFWDLQPYLPEQTRWYLPAFIAIVYLMNHASEHGIVPAQQNILYAHTDTIRITHAAEFSKISEKLNIPIDQLRQLNPTYRKDFIPVSSKPQILVLPSDRILSFLKYENLIYSYYDTADYYQNIKITSDTANKNSVIYVVRKGDFLHKIALEYNCSPENIIAWNNLQDDQLKIGQQLIIWVKKSKTDKNAGKYFYYTVKKGDTLYSIAERFKCDSINDIKIVNNIQDEKDLKAGQIIKIRALQP
jgi:membrane-bound lytic murein transglycosylase D